MLLKAGHNFLEFFPPLPYSMGGQGCTLLPHLLHVRCDFLCLQLLRGPALAAVGGGLGSSPMPWLPPAPLTEAQPGPLTPRKLQMLEKTALFALLCPPWDKQGSCTVGRLPRKAGRLGKGDWGFVFNTS